MVSIKKRKARAGQEGKHQTHKRLHKRDKHRKNAGARLLGLGEDVKGRNLLSRLEQGGLVAQMKKYKIPDQMEFRKSKAAAALEKQGKLRPVTLGRPKPQPTGTELVDKTVKMRAEMRDRKRAKQHVSIHDFHAKRAALYLNKYGEDYEAMAGDPHNYDQLRPKQLKELIRTFKRTTRQFPAYMALRREALRTVGVREVLGEEDEESSDEEESDKVAGEEAPETVTVEEVAEKNKKKKSVQSEVGKASGNLVVQPNLEKTSGKKQKPSNISTDEGKSNEELNSKRKRSKKNSEGTEQVGKKSRKLNSMTIAQDSDSDSDIDCAADDIDTNSQEESERDSNGSATDENALESYDECADEEEEQDPEYQDESADSDDEALVDSDDKELVDSDDDELDVSEDEEKEDSADEEEEEKSTDDDLENPVGESKDEGAPKDSNVSMEGSDPENSGSEVSVYDSDDPSDGENGMKFMARVRALEMRERGLDGAGEEDSLSVAETADKSKKNANRRNRAKKSKKAKQKAIKKFK